MGPAGHTVLEVGLQNDGPAIVDHRVRTNALSNQGFVGEPLPFIDIDATQVICFMLFWAIQVYFIAKGIESIRWLETLAAPFLILVGRT